MDTISLRHPEKDMEQTIPLVFSREAMLWGPLVWVKERQYTLALVHLMVTIITFGFYWFWFARYFNHIKVKRLMREGYEPLHRRDMTIADQFGLKEYIEGRRLYLARLGSADDQYDMDYEA